MSLLILNLFLLSASLCSALCSIEGTSSGRPPRKLPKPIPPFIITHNDACPYYEGEYGCCNPVQTQKLTQNFKSVDLIFAADCPVCALNLKIFWCEFTCNPNQSEFLRPHDYIKVLERSQWFDALNVTFAISASSVCELFRSCNKVPETMMMSSNGQGFIQFQGDRGVDRGGVKMNLVFTDEEKDGLKPLIFETHTCNKTFPNDTIKGFTNITKCACNFCSQSCGVKSQEFVATPYFEGFNWRLVLVVYLVMAIITGGGYYIYKRMKQSNEPEVSQDNKSLLNEIN